MSAQIPAVLLVHEDGSVASQNRAALRLLGPRKGQYCWDVMSGLEGAEGLPCKRGCTRKLLASGMDKAAHAPFRYADQQHQLSCIPIDGNVVCALTRNAKDSPRAWQALTPRELSVLELLAEGETTASAATYRTVFIPGNVPQTCFENILPCQNMLFHGVKTQIMVVHSIYQDIIIIPHDIRAHSEVSLKHFRIIEKHMYGKHTS